MKNRANTVYVNNKGIFFKSDCLELLHYVKQGTIDLVFTDPPFNLGKDYATPAFNDRMETSEYHHWCRTWFSELIRVLKPGGTLCIYSLPKWAINMGAWLNEQPQLTYRSLITLKMKSGFPIRGRLHPAVYTILYYVKNGSKPTFNVVRNKTPICRYCGREVRDYGGYRKKFAKFEDEDGIPWIQISDFWEDTRPARQDKSRKSQVNELPIHIPERIILMGSNENDVVLDIFGGGGSTYHAAQMHNRYWIGCDIGDSQPLLSRFATIWGRHEATRLPSKLKQCFEEKFIIDQIKTRNKKNIHPILKVPILLNGHSLLKEAVVSKSKVLGF